jgi:hypothetical protein
VSACFLEGGHYVIRDDWTPKSDFLFFKCGPFGLGINGPCSHAHCDLLSFQLWLEGKPLLIDSGTYTYHGPWRDHFRLTAAHNAMMIDELDQARPLPHFGWKTVPQAECIDWAGKRVAGAMQLSDNVWHHREINHPKDGFWEIIDFVESEGVHKLTWFFHFAPIFILQQSGDQVYVMDEETGNPFVVVYTPPRTRLEIKSGWYSRSYGQKEPKPLLQATWLGEIPSAGVDFIWRFQHIEKARKVKS